VEDDAESQEILSLVRRVNDGTSQSGFSGSQSASGDGRYDGNLLSGDSNARFASLAAGANGGGTNMESAVRFFFFFFFFEFVHG
jgi:hypothetical protein